MRVIGALLFVAGAVAAGWTIRASFERAYFGLVAPVAVLVAVAGLVLAFVPGFF